jgi:hypothetical protein
MLAAILVTFAAPTPAKADVDVSFGFFYSNLEPHGSWLVSAQYGRVWQPAAYTRGWNPYYDGHWECSDVGWVWVSDYSWGAVPYHYGTWVLDPGHGWVWIPGYTWAPSWVVFRTGPDYIGWSPVPPGFSVGASYTFVDDPNLYVFVGAGDFLAPRVRTRVVPIETTRSVIRNTTIVNNITIDNDVVVNRGPDVRVVERATGKKVEVQSIERVSRVAPTSRFTRADLRIREKNERALRAAQPVPKDEPIPDVRRGPSKQERRRDEQVQAPVSRERTSPRLDAQRDNRMEQRGSADREAMARQSQEQMRAERKAQVQKQERAEARQQAEQKAKARDDKKKKKKSGDAKSDEKKNDDKGGKER